MGKITYKINRKKSSVSIFYKDIEVTYSDPSVQIYNEPGFINSMKEVMYFYYTFTAYKNHKKVLEARAYDFSIVDRFYEVLEKILEQDEKDFLELYDEQEDGSYLLMFTNTNWIHEDGIFLKSIKKDKLDKTISFDLEFSVEKNPTKVVMEDLSLDDLSIFKEAIGSFLKITIDKSNQSTKAWIKGQMKNKSIDPPISGAPTILRKREYGYDSNDELSLIRVTDELSDVWFLGKDNKSVLRYSDIKIKEFTNNEVVFEFAPNDIKKVSISYILYIEAEMDKKKLEYDVNDIIEDFFNNYILGSKIIFEDFKTKDKSFLMNIYADAIIDSCWMCRDEHPYMKKINANTENVSFAKHIIKTEIMDELIKKARAYK